MERHAYRILPAGHYGGGDRRSCRYPAERLDHNRTEDEGIRTADRQACCHTSRAACLNSATACAEMALRVLGIGPGR